jgi:hypothetical protein
MKKLIAMMIFFTAVTAVYAVDEAAVAEEKGLAIVNATNNEGLDNQLQVMEQVLSKKDKQGSDPIGEVYLPTIDPGRLYA